MEHIADPNEEPVEEDLAAASGGAGDDPEAPGYVWPRPRHADGPGPLESDQIP